MTLMIGAPVWRREWIIDRYFDHCLKALDYAGIKDFKFAFLGDYRDPTFEHIRDFGQSYKVYCKQYRQDDRAEDVRDWDHERYKEMVVIRNLLLDIPRNSDPDYFLSLDTDILLHEQAIANLLESAERFDAVGGKLYMTPRSNRFSSYGMLTRFGQLRRPETKGVVKVDVIMAAKLMSPDAYNTNYQFHTQGEDAGWSIAVRDKGMTLGFDGRIANKHVMERDMLDKVDERVGY